MRTFLALTAYLAIAATAVAARPFVTSPSRAISEQDQPVSATAVACPSFPVLTVSADAHVNVTPDHAVISLGVLAQEKDAAAAQSKVNESMAKIIAAIRSQGVPAEQIQTSALTLTALYTNPQPPRADGTPAAEPKIYAYRADSTITIHLKDLKRIGATIDAGLANGANQLQGVSFGLQDETKSKTEAVQQAAANARSKARAMAAALDVRLVELVEASETVPNVYPRPYAGRAMMQMDAAAAPTPIEAGQLDVSAVVTLRYRIAAGEH